MATRNWREHQDMESERVYSLLCYGDSNTYGYDAEENRRFSRHVRWPGVLRDSLGQRFEVVEEGLGSRTTGWDDPSYPYKNGKSYLPLFLESHSPLDMVILFLGTNDLKWQYHLTPTQIAASAGELVTLVKRSEAGPQGQPPQVLLLAPPQVGTLRHYRELYKGAEEKSRALGHEYRQVAQRCGCAFLDTAPLIAPCSADGVHLSAHEHYKLGQVVASSVRELLDIPGRD